MKKFGLLVLLFCSTKSFFPAVGPQDFIALMDMRLQEQEKKRQDIIKKLDAYRQCECHFLQEKFNKFLNEFDLCVLGNCSPEIRVLMQNELNYRTVDIMVHKAHKQKLNVEQAKAIEKTMLKLHITNYAELLFKTDRLYEKFKRQQLSEQPFIVQYSIRRQRIIDQKQREAAAYFLRQRAGFVYCKNFKDGTYFFQKKR